MDYVPDASKCGPGQKPSFYKKRIVALSEKLGLPLKLQHLLIVKGMIESECLSSGGRDESKDPGREAWCGEGCINFGFANLNTSMIRKIIEAEPELATKYGLTEANIKATNCQQSGVNATCNPKQSVLNQDTDESYELTIRMVIAGLKKWGLQSYLNFVRGGETYWADPSPGNYERFKAGPFMKGLSLMMDVIAKDEKLLTDDRRVALQIPWV